MSFQIYTYEVEAKVPMAAWDEVYFSLLSLRAHVQSLPGFSTWDISATIVDDGGAVALHITTEWEYLGALLVWLDAGYTPAGIIKGLAESAPVESRVGERV